MSNLYNFGDARRFLIKPLERLWFVIIFVLVTAICRIMSDLVFSQSMFDLLWQQHEFQFVLAEEIVTGTLIGFFQWLMLRKYISDWKWILAITMSFTLLSALRSVSNMWTSSVLATSANELSERPSSLTIALLVSLFIIAFIGAILISGYLQWYVLQPYVARARWWILTHIPLVERVIRELK